MVRFAEIGVVLTTLAAVAAAWLLIAAWNPGEAMTVTDMSSLNYQGRVHVCTIWRC